MTLVAERSLWPPQIMIAGPTAAGGGAFALTIDATNDQCAVVLQSEVSDSIAKVYVRIGTLTTAAVMRVGAYALGTDGRPALTPTYWSANSTGATPSGDLTISGANTWQTFTFTDPAILVPGDRFALVLSYVSGSTPSFQILQAAVTVFGLQGQDQLQLFSNGGGAYANSNTAPMEWIVEMTSGGVVTFPGLIPLNSALTLTAFNTGTADELALKWTAPTKKRCIGIRAGLFNLTAASALTGSLWDSTADGPDGQTPLAQSASFDGDGVYSATQDGYIDFIFTTPYTVAAGTTYYAGIRNTTANAVSMGIMAAGSPTNAIRAFGIGSNLAHLGSRTWSGTNPGAWTDTTTSLPIISMLFDQSDDGAGGGGGGQRVIGG